MSPRSHCNEYKMGHTLVKAQCSSSLLLDISCGRQTKHLAGAIVNSAHRGDIPAVLEEIWVLRRRRRRRFMLLRISKSWVKVKVRKEVEKGWKKKKERNNFRVTDSYSSVDYHAMILHRLFLLLTWLSADSNEQSLCETIANLCCIPMNLKHKTDPSQSLKPI